MDHVINNLKEIVLDKPVDIIIKQIKELLVTGQLKPGDRLPPERKLSEIFGVGRTPVREAIRKLEFYGIVKTRPQSGTFVASIGISALETLISDVLKIDAPSFLSLVETREILELSSVALACERHTAEDIILLEEALVAYNQKAQQGIRAVDEDMLFHLAIAEAAKNKVLKSLLLIIIPDILANYTVFNVCDRKDNSALQEHNQLFHNIRDRNVEAATAIMKQHLDGVMKFAKSIVQ